MNRHSQVEAAATSSAAPEAQLYRQVLDHLQDVLVIYDSNRRIQFINQAAVDLVGRPKSDFLGMRDEEVWPSEVTDLYLPKLKKAFSTKKPQRLEISPKLSGVKEYTHAVTYVPIIDEDGNLQHMLGATYDVTDLFKTKESLQKERNFFDNLFQNASLGIAVVEPPDWRYTMINPAYAAIPGNPEITMVGRSVAEVFPEVASKGGIELLEQVARQRQPVNAREYQASVGKEREETWWNVDHIPLFDASGELSSVLILASEVTEQVMARRKVEETAQQTRDNLLRLRAVLKTVRKGIIISNSKG